MPRHDLRRKRPSEVPFERARAEKRQRTCSPLETDEVDESASEMCSGSEVFDDSSACRQQGGAYVRMGAGDSDCEEAFSNQAGAYVRMNALSKMRRLLTVLDETELEFDAWPVSE